MKTSPPLDSLPLHAAPRPRLNGAQILLQSLVESGVETIFGYPGGVVLSVYDYLPQFPIRHILVRHEQGAVHMAEGFAKASGKTGVALVTSGPGATNTVTGITDAYYDSIPLVVITGNVPTTLLGGDAFQEADIVGMTRSCTKHNISVRRVEDLAGAIKEAFYVAASGRPGPVLVDIPKDILTGEGEFNYHESVIDLPGYRPHETFTDTQVRQALDLLKSAKQPVMLIGGGVIGGAAHEEVLAFAERMQIPVASSLMGLGGFPYEHPLYLGYCGMHGHYWANIAIANADVLMIVGNRLNERQTGNASRFARNARIIHIDLDPGSLNKNVEALIPIQGDTRNVLKAFLAQSENIGPLEGRDAWRARIEQFKQRRVADNGSPQRYLKPEGVIERLFHFLPKDAIITTEVGQHQMWAAQYFNLSRPRSWITSGGLGTMGFGFPAAIGAQFAFPDSLVLDIAGDGSIQMTIQELATAVDYAMPVKIAIINNGYLGMVRQWQGRFFQGESEVRMTSPDYVKLADAYGAVGFAVSQPEEVDAVIQKAYAITDRPVIMDFRVQEKADIYPWVPAGGSNDQMLMGAKTDDASAEGGPRA
ncbi:MAG: biosynthetic-type acetolactate synthase large subunit [Vampirovibrionales bacterium]|nr:biosynthetic-type acetolactate synthase large subunit [Vampirovibrionales bacterium]